VSEKIEYVLIGGVKDGERIKCEADREYVAFPIGGPMPLTSPAPISIDNFPTFEKAIYTRRQLRVDRFAPLTCLGAIELTDREVLAKLISAYGKGTGKGSSDGL
jgi:hypothetical protein